MALRSFRLKPGFSVLAVVLMALGIGANTAVFSVVNAVLLRPLAYHTPDRIVTIANLWKNSGRSGMVSAPDFHDWHDQSAAFTAMAYYTPWKAAVATGAGAEYAGTARITPEFFGVFEVQPVLGRFFTADEVKPGSNGVVVISYAFWRSHFGGNPNVLGRSVRLFGRTLPIVGVLPAGFHFPEDTDLWLPADTVFSETRERGSHNYFVVARLKPDVSIEQARAQMSSIAARLSQQYPRSNAGKGVEVDRLLDSMVTDVRLTLYLLLGAVVVVLLIACANMANLLLAKATARTREIAIRAAVGASRGRIVRQLITESLLLAVVAGAVGLALALWGASALVQVAPADVPRLAETRIDAWVLAFTFGVSLAASLLFGLAPALEASRVDLSEALKQGSARATGGRAGRLRAVLVVAEMALSVVLLCGAGLLLKSFVALQNVALGFRPEHVLMMKTGVQSSSLEGARRATRFYKTLLADIARLPGVLAEGGVRTPPGRITSNGGYWVDHEPKGDELSVASAQAVFSIVTPGSFAALGIPLQEGRDFQDGDTYEAPFTVIVNESLARTAYPGQDPIGHVIYCGFDSVKPMRIVGVVGDIRQAGPASPPRPELYMPYEQHPGASTALNIMVRTAAEPTSIAEGLRRTTRELSADVPVTFTTLEELMAANTAAPRFRTLLLGLFAGLAVCLAMAGVYGVMAYVVGLRGGEIGLRMALGASPGNVLRMVLRQGLTLAAPGLALGLAGAAVASRLLASLLFLVKPTDPLTYAGVVTVLGAAAMVACYIPARRATRVDPLAALRQE